MSRPANNVNLAQFDGRYMITGLERISPACGHPMQLTLTLMGPIREDNPAFPLQVVDLVFQTLSPFTAALPTTPTTPTTPKLPPIRPLELTE